MEAGKVYKVTLQPVTTSNYFEAGNLRSEHEHRRERTTTSPMTDAANNDVHHSKQYPSELTITVVKSKRGRSAPAARLGPLCQQ